MSSQRVDTDNRLVQVGISRIYTDPGAAFEITDWSGSVGCSALQVSFGFGHEFLDPWIPLLQSSSLCLFRCELSSYRPFLLCALFFVLPSYFSPAFFLSFFTLSSPFPCFVLWHAAMNRQMKFCPTLRGSLISPLCRALQLVWLTPCRVLACRPPAVAGTHPPTCNNWILFHYYAGIAIDHSIEPSWSFPVNILTQFRVI